MTGKVDTLKSRNWKYVLPFIGLNVVAFYIVAAGIPDALGVAEKAIDSALWSVGLGFVGLILNGLIGGNAKAILVFFRLQNALPGCRAFSRYMHDDPRIKPSVLQRLYGDLPTDPVEQNGLWYNIYRRHVDEPSVIDAHQSYLAARDITALSAMFLVAFGALAFFLTERTTVTWYYVGALVLVYVAASYAGRNYGVRLVTNVLAIESQRTEN